MEPISVQACLAFAAVGLVSHLTFFINMDPMDGAPTLALMALTVPISTTIALNSFFNYTYLAAAVTSTAWFSSFVGAVFVSMATYRTFFHRLKSFPGPAWAKVSQCYHVGKIWKDLDHFRVLDKLHVQYGEYVRVGPNLLSISDPDIVDTIYGPGTEFLKDNWYQGGKPLTTLHQMTDRTMHDKRRKHGWDKAFTTKSLRSYDQRLIKYTEQLVLQMRKRAGEAVDARTWINWFAFDVMGDLAFGKSFEALEKGESHFFINLIHEANSLVGRLGTMPWIIHVLTKIPMPPSLNAFMQMIKFSDDMVDDRKTYEPDEPDVMSHILGAGDFFDDPKIEKLLLTGDARLLIIAGSDTTATTLTFALYHLANNQSLVDKIRAELEQHNIRRDEKFTVLSLTHLEYLNGFIEETLRLHPPVPGGMYRKSPKGGATVNGTFIPAGTIVVAPQYTIQRSPKAWAKPNEFIPERWNTQPELILHKDAFFPFSIGRYGCIGKQLALNELRTVIARLALEFDISFAKGETGRTLLEDSHDTFTTACGKLELVFTPRD